jgi:hypothetical protein
MDIADNFDQAVTDLRRVSDKIQSSPWMSLYGFAEGRDLQTEMPTLPKSGSVRKSMIEKCFVGWVAGPRQGLPQLLCSSLGDAIAVSQYFGWTTVSYSCAVILEEDA